MDDTVLTHRDDIQRRERDQHRVSALQSKSMQHFVNHPPSAAMHATAASSVRGPPIPAHPGAGGLAGGANANSNSAFQV